MAPVFLLLPLQILFAKGTVLCTIGSAPLHVYAVLYLLAFTCFGSAVLLIVSGLKNLYRILRTGA